MVFYAIYPRYAQRIKYAQRIFAQGWEVTRVHSLGSDTLACHFPKSVKPVPKKFSSRK